MNNASGISVAYFRTREPSGLGERLDAAQRKCEPIVPPEGKRPPRILAGVSLCQSFIHGQNVNLATNVPVRGSCVTEPMFRFSEGRHSLRKCIHRINTTW